MQIWFPLTMQGQHPKVAQATGHELDSSTLQRDEVWCDWKKLVQSLRLALESKSCDSQLRQLVNECMALYRASCTIPPTTDNILASISGRHSSQLEAAFMWLGAWRPSSAITLVYSKTGDTMGKCDGLESSTPPPCMLSESQISIMEALREHTCRAEVEISSSLASVQMLLADQNMTEAFGIGSPLDGMQATLSDSEDVEAQRLMNSKLVSLRTLYMQANGLRLQTLQELQNLLNPTQTAQCAVAAFELAYALRNLGDAFAFKRRSGPSESAKESSKHAA